MVNSTAYDGIRFLVSTDYSKIEKRNSICINLLGYENDLVYPVHVSGETFEDCADLLLITNGKLHYVSIKNFNRFMFNKTKQE